VIYWAPKAACSSVLDVFVHGILAQSRPVPPRRKQGLRVWVREQGYQLDHRQARRLVLDGGYRSIAMIRDPYDRLVSAYLQKFVQRNGNPLSEFNRLEPFARAFLNHHMPQCRQEGRYQGISFRDFVGTVCDVITKRDGSEPALDAHFSTQVPFAYAEAGFRYDDLYSMAESGRFFDRLSALSGVVLNVPHLNVTPYAPDTVDEGWCDRLSVDLAQNKQRFRKENFRDPGLRARVRHVFAVDYATLTKAETAASTVFLQDFARKIEGAADKNPR